MTCDACTAAESQPNAATFGQGCTSCLARALAVTGAHLESQQAGAMTEQYRTALAKCFGEAWKEGHEMVKGWGAKVRQTKARVA